MTPANENDWQLKYDRLVLWRNATWRRADKGIDPNGRTISVRSPFLTIQLPFMVYVSFLRKIRSLCRSSALMILLDSVYIFLFLYGYNSIFSRIILFKNYSLNILLSCICIHLNKILVLMNRA